MRLLSSSRCWRRWSYLLLTEKLPVDLTAFLGLVVLIFGGYLTPSEAFAGFSSPAVITMLSVFIVSAALFETGIGEWIGGRIHTLVGSSETRLLVVLMMTAGVMSAFMNNIAATAVLMPAVATIGPRAGLVPSRLFMPLAFGAILGGTTTQVGTTPNILAAQILSERGLEPFTLFDYTPFGLAIMAVGVVFMSTIGRRLLPVHEKHNPPSGDHLLIIGEPKAPSNSPELGAVKADRATQEAALESEDVVMVEVAIAPRSAAAGRSLIELRFPERHGGLLPLALRRGAEAIHTDLAKMRLEVGDALLLQGPKREIRLLATEPDFLVLSETAQTPRQIRRAPQAMGCLLLMIILVASGLMPIHVAAFAAAALVVLAGALTMDQAYRAIEWRVIFLVAAMLLL